MKSAGGGDIYASKPIRGANIVSPDADLVLDGSAHDGLGKTVADYDWTSVRDGTGLTGPAGNDR